MMMQELFDSDPDSVRDVVERVETRVCWISWSERIVLELGGRI